MRFLFVRLLWLPLFAALLTLPLRPAAAQDKSDLRVQHLRCEYQEAPLGIETPRPRLSWQMTSKRRGERQTAYRVLVASDAALLREGAADLWDSGKVTSDQSLLVEYGGAALRTGQRCWWTVRVWDRDDKATPYGKPAWWEMGLLRPEDRVARWITATDAAKGDDAEPFAGASWIWHDEEGTHEGVRYFRRAFDAPFGGQTGKGTVIITADDQFTLYLNGQEVGKSSGQGDAWRSPLTFDVTERLRPGRNVLAVAARNTGGAAGLLVALRIAPKQRDGSVTTFFLPTDRLWKTADAEVAGWQSPDFDDAAWKPARVVAPYGEGPWGRFQTGGVGTGPGRYLRREFPVTKPVRRARLYASSLGIYEPYLNGKRVGADVFAPGWTDYRKRVYYQTYDVTRLLQRGANALGIVLGDGWYAGYVGLVGRGVYGSVPLAWAQLRIEYADGTADTVATDASWRGTTAGPITGSDLLMGENYDARREGSMNGWSSPGFTATDWQAASEREVAVPLEAQRGPAVRRQEELRPRSVKSPAKGAYVFDLGQNMVGWARLKVRGPAGARVTLRFAEMLNPDGTIYTTNYRGARCTDTYTLRGDSQAEVYEPHFTFRGFRYVEVTGWPGDKPPGADTITGVVVHSDTPRVGTMETSHPMVNQLLKNIDWGQRGNFLSVPTDCPQRDERLGWMGDAQIFVHTAAYNRDVASFFTKWLVDVDDAQSKEGAFSDVSPRVAAGEGTAAWGDAGVICPWTMYVCYGDRRFLEDHYGAMTRWVAYCEAHSSGLLRPAAGYGDWLSIRADTPTDVLATAYFAYSTRLVARAAKALGKTEDAARYEDLFQRIKAAFIQAYVAPDGRIKGDTQTDYVLALRFDLLPDELRPTATRYLAQNIASRAGHLSTGFVGVGYLCPVLSDTGHDPVAYRLLENDTFPSWGYSIKQGATTIWERWDGWTEDKGFQDPGMNSFNHYSFGSVGEWLYGYVAGIQADPDAPGYRHIRIAPRPGGNLSHATATLDSPYGPIASAWRWDGRALDMRVVVPANTAATIYVPARDAASVREGSRPAAESEGVRFLRMSEGAAVYEVGSGTYHFRSDGTAPSGGVTSTR
jgi:alpha-L-rhamnosidase